MSSYRGTMVKLTSMFDENWVVASSNIWYIKKIARFPLHNILRNESKSIKNVYALVCRETEGGYHVRASKQGKKW